MSSNEQYELLDFGEGEKLERFAGKLVRRPCPNALKEKLDPNVWDGSDLRFLSSGKTLSNGEWTGASLEPWRIRFGPALFKLNPTPFGHLGIFPEQARNWEWVSGMHKDLSGLKALNLFAYTGGTTMALAARGVEVVHIDSSKSIVKWARENAEISGLGDSKIRWIVEDAVTFVEREIKRGNRYDIVVADPPSFGHGLKRQSWKYDRDIDSLVANLAELTRSRLRMLLISGHTIGYDHNHLTGLIRSSFGNELSGEIVADSMCLKSRFGKTLPSGYSVRYVKDFF